MMCVCVTVSYLRCEMCVSEVWEVFHRYLSCGDCRPGSQGQCCDNEKLPHDVCKSHPGDVTAWPASLLYIAARWGWGIVGVASLWGCVWACVQTPHSYTPQAITILHSWTELAFVMQVGQMTMSKVPCVKHGESKHSRHSVSRWIHILMECT